MRHADALENDRGTIQKRRGLFAKDRECGVACIRDCTCWLHDITRSSTIDRRDIANDTWNMSVTASGFPVSSACVTTVRPMMYGYGDSDQPLPETVDLVEVRCERGSFIPPEAALGYVQWFRRSSTPA